MLTCSGEKAAPIFPKVINDSLAFCALEVLLTPVRDDLGEIPLSKFQLAPSIGV